MVYADYQTLFFAKQYPNKRVIEVNAGLPGTDSNLGLFRMKKHLVESCGNEGPDIVFVEFAVNDMYASNATPQLVQQRMEGIVRQLASLPKQPVIVFVYSASVQSARPDLGFTNYLNSAGVHQQVASYYGIGSLNLCEYVAGGTDIEGNDIVWDYTGQNADSWTGDGVHPNDKGYTAYADYMIDCFRKQPEQYFKKLTWKEVPMSGYEFGSPQVISPVNNPDVTTTGTWKTDKNFSVWFKDGVRKSNKGGSSMIFRFTGRSIGIFSAFGSGAANAGYVIDMGSSNPISGQLTPNNSSGGWMVGSVLLRHDLSPGEHMIKITTYDPPNATEDGFVVGYFMVDPEQPDPIVSNVSTDAQGSVLCKTKLTGSYSYLNEQEEGKTESQWFVSNQKNGSYTVINGASGTEFTPGEEYIGRYIKYSVTPKDAQGNVGKTFFSEPVAVTVPSAKQCCSATEISASVNNGTWTSVTDVTNRLSGINLKISLITAEYQVSEGGVKMLIQTKKDSREVTAGGRFRFRYP